MAWDKMKHGPRKIDEMGGPHGATFEQIEILKRVFRGMELKDAPADMLIHVTTGDIDRAVRNDLEHCVFARSCSRMFESHIMVFLSWVAYVDVEDEDGVRRAFRFRLSEKMHDAIKKFDETGVAETGTYKMYAPKPSLKLDKLRSASRKRRQDGGHRKKKLEGSRRRHAEIKAKARVVKTINSAGPVGVIRSGLGLIQTVVVSEK